MTAPDRPPHRHAAIHGLAVLLWLAVITALALRSLQLPVPAAPAGAPATEASGGRALADVREIARRPHPAGTEDHARIREVLLGRLTALGLQPQVQEGTAAAILDIPTGRVGWAARVRNIVARLPGRHSSGAVLLVTHYDSTPGSLGAADSGAAVAAILETLRALRAGPPLDNDLIVLFTDAEEFGEFGAQAFAADHPWAAGVRAVLNFDARGGGGPLLMFETGPGDAWLVRHLAASPPYPVASSLAATVYRYIPAGTDFTEFLKRRFPGLNFAFIERPTVYHSAADTAANLDPRTLQQLGTVMLGLTRRLGSADLGRRPAGNAVFFNLTRDRLIVYPLSWSLPLALLAAVVFGLAAVLGFRNGKLTAGGMARGLLAYLLTLLAVPLTALGALLAVHALDPSFRWLLQGATYNSPLYFAGFTALAVAVAAAIYALFRHRTGLCDATLGALLGSLLLTLTAAWFVPAGSYLLTWPLLFATLGAVPLLASPPRESLAAPRLWETAALALGAVPALLLLAPWVALLFTGLTVLVAWAVVLFIALLMGFLVPHLSLLGGARRPWWLPVTAGLAGLILLGTAVASPGFDDRHPRPDSVFYALDAATGKAAWASLDQEPDAWTTQFLGRSPRRESLQPFTGSLTRRYLQAPAPALALAPPEVTFLAAEPRRNGGQTVRLRLRSPRGAAAIRVDIPPAARLVSFTVDGRPPEERSNGTGRLDWLLLFAPPPGGFDLALEMADSQPFELNVVGYTFSLPPLPYSPRPAGLIPQAALVSDTTLVRTVLTVPGHASIPLPEVR